MIVYCEKCNSKFQVEDAKIPEAGIKARCSVCSHAFLLKKEPVATTPVIPAEPAPKPVQEAEKKSVAGEFDASIFKEEASPKEPAAVSVNSSATAAKAASPPADNGGFFSRNTSQPEPASASAASSQGGDIVVEIAEPSMFDDVQEIYEAAEPVAENRGSATVSPGNIFAAFDNRRKPEAAETTAAGTRRAWDEPAGNAAASDEMARYGFSSGNETTPFTEPPLTKPAAGPTINTNARFPEVISSAGLPSGQVMGRAEREIVSLLDQKGMTDEYVVQMVQEVCNAVKYVEGVEKPDWPTRMMGLEMLCKIKGLYAGEKKEDPANRQVQIVTGINM